LIDFLTGASVESTLLPEEGQFASFRYADLLFGIAVEHGVAL